MPALPFTHALQELVRRSIADQVEAGDIEVIVACDGHEVAALAAFGKTPREHVWVLHLLAVQVAWQRRGIGLALKEEVMAVCAGRGGQRIISAVHQDNLAMQAVNRRLGIEAEADPNGDGLFYTAVLRLP